MARKKKVLIVNELHTMNTGYSSYMAKLLPELVKCEDLEVAELAGYCHPQIHADIIANSKWKIYPNAPASPQDEQMYNSHPTNEFGAWKFEQVCLDFLPDIVIAIRDQWMDGFILDSAFRRFYKTIFMPTCDGNNLQAEWLDTYRRIDYVLTYQDWSAKTIQEETSGLVNWRGTAAPAVDTEVFKPVADKRAHKESMGVDPNSIIIGITARNQKRKLYPNICNSFSKFLHDQKEAGINTSNVYLYWHTSYPDLGWDIPELLKQYGLSHKVLFTYYCARCKNFKIHFYSDVLNVCKSCGAKTLTFSNSQQGISKEQLANIYNLFDLYAQIVTVEGFGIPVIEAAACGVPVCGTESTGLNDNITKVGGYKFSPIKWEIECETRRFIPIVDDDAFTEYLKKFTLTPEPVRKAMSLKTYQNCMKHYGSWQNVAQVWKDVIDQVPLSEQDWLSYPEIAQIPQSFPNETSMSDEQFVAWLLANVLLRPQWINSHIGLKMLRDLSWGKSNASNNLGLLSNDLSLLGDRPKYEIFNREKLFNIIRDIRTKFNEAEKVRWHVLNDKGLIK